MPKRRYLPFPGNPMVVVLLGAGHGTGALLTLSPAAWSLTWRPTGLQTWETPSLSRFTA
jgi:hypothetical protein